MASSSSAGITPFTAEEHAILNATQYLTTVIQAYIDDANARNVPGTFFRKHGGMGIERALNFMVLVEDLNKEIHSRVKYRSMGEPLAYLRMELKRLLTDKKILPGKNKRHSLKTYLFAYYLALTNWDGKSEIKKEFDGKLSDLQAKGSEQIKAEYENTFQPILQSASRTPDQIFRIMFYELCRKMQFVRISENNVNPSAFVEVNNEQLFLPDCCDFNRSDKVAVRLFHPFVSLDARADKPFDLKGWSEQYETMIEEFKGIVIVPVVHKDENTTFFNIVVAYKNNVYHINPGSMIKDIVKKMFGSGLSSQIAEGIRGIIIEKNMHDDPHGANTPGANKNPFSEPYEDQVKKNDIFVGQQGYFNTVEGSLYQINYAVALACLPVNFFASSKSLMSVLEKTNLSCREDDEYILVHDRFYREAKQPPAERNMDDEYLSRMDSVQREEAFFSDLAKEIEKEKTRQQRLVLHVAIDQIKYYLRRAKSEEGSHFRAEIAEFLQAKLEEKLHEENEIEKLNTELNLYANTRAKRKTVDDLFLNSAERLKIIHDVSMPEDLRKVAKIVQKKIIAEKLLGTNLVECALLLSCYESIAKSSGLREALASSLAWMLNAECDFKKTLGSKPFYPSENADEQFHKWLVSQATFLFNDAFMDEYEAFKKEMMEWDRNSASLYNRFVESKEDRMILQKDMRGENGTGMEGLYTNFKEEIAALRGKSGQKVTSTVIEVNESNRVSAKR